MKVLSALTALAVTAAFSMPASGQIIPLLDDDLTDLSNTSNFFTTGGDGTLTLESESGNSFARLTEPAGGGPNTTGVQFFGLGDPTQDSAGDEIVSPGDLIEVRFDLRLAVGAGGVANVELFSEIAGGGTSASEILTTEIFDIGPGFQSFSFVRTAGPDVTNGLTLQFTASTGGADGSFSTLDFDNVSVSIIPEPATLGLLGLGGLTMLARRRRRSA